MKKITKFMMVITMILSLVISAQSSCENRVYAMSKKNQAAHKALRKTLVEKKKEFFGDEMSKEMGLKLKYSYKDIDGDKVDELIIYPGYGYYTEGIFDYQNGKVVESATVGQGEFTTFYTTNKVIYIHNAGHMGVLYDYYYKKNTKTNQYKVVAYVEKEYALDDYVYEKAPVKTTYYKNGKRVSKSTYTSYVKKLKANSKVVKHSKLKWSNY